MHLPLEITSEITDYFAPHLNEYPQDYVCVYGSSVYSPDKKTSDVDLFAVAHKQGTLAMGPLVEFVTEMHVRHGRKLDAEVPYENKVLYDQIEIESALKFGGFDVYGNRIVVPPIQKNVTFLGSAAMKARLALNGLTTPHSVIGNDFEKYHKTRLIAGETVTLLAIAQQSDNEFNIEMLFDRLTENSGGKKGELYLGYKTEYPIVKEHLFGVLAGALERFNSRKILQKSGNEYRVNWNVLHPLGIINERLSEGSE